MNPSPDTSGSRGGRIPTNQTLQLSSNLVPDVSVLRRNVSSVEAEDESQSKRVHLAVLHPSLAGCR